MKISVTFRNTEGENWHKEYIDQKLKKLEKYMDNPVEARVVISVEKFRNAAEVNLMTNGQNINAKEEAKDMYLAIDNAIEKIERQLKKRKERIRGHKTNAAKGEEITSEEAYFDDMDEIQETRIVEMRKVVLKPMSIEDALMEIDSSKNRFVVYRDSSTETVSIIYVRDDGKYALIETSS
ncbi:MAG: ribosome-associated translation inhibitor RaiA [Deltaproteobacteria bacterium]|nr:ribosome-associated translation inhibitor RaiA [Deltaproteobacteria bacterium]